MQEDNIVSQVSDNPETNYLDTIKELKENSVSKADYEKLAKENKRLLNDFINGKTPDAPAPVRPSSDDLRKDLFINNKDMSNLDYVTKALQLRENVLAEEGYDVFAGTNNDEDKQSAQKLADVLTECVEIANGDNVAFVNEVNRRVVDSPFSKIRKR